MVIIAVVGAIYFFIARPDRNVERHLEGDATARGASGHCGLT